MQSQTVIIIENSNRFTAESTISLILTSINIISCSYVLSRLYFIRRLKGVEIKYPTCFAITCLIYSIIQIINIFINNSKFQNYRTGIFGRIFEKFYPTFLTVNLLLIGFLELTTLSKMKNKIDDDNEKTEKTEKYDNNMWQEMFLLSWVASIFRINRYEQLELNYIPPKRAIFEYHFNAIIIFIVIISAIFYLSELKKNLHKVISRELLIKRSCNYMNPNVIRAYIFCILPFLFQWSLILFYNIMKSIGINDLSLNILLIIAVNIGGIGYGISYFIYERRYLYTNFSNDNPIILSYGTLLPTDDQLISVSTQ